MGTFVFTPPHQWDFMEGEKLMYSTDRIGIVLSISTKIEGFEPDKLNHYGKCLTTMHKYGRYNVLEAWVEEHKPIFAGILKEPLILLDMSVVTAKEFNRVIQTSALNLSHYLNLIPITI